MRPVEVPRSFEEKLAQQAEYLLLLGGLETQNMSYEIRGYGIYHFFVGLRGH